MYSRLDSILSHRFRYTEPTDTRQEIRREDKTGERKKRKDKEKKGAAAIQDELPVVSVDALQVFLKGLIMPQQAIDEGGSSVKIEKPPVSKNAKQAKAISAYQTAAHRQSSEVKTEKKTPAPPPVKEELSSEEQRLIHQLIKDLEDLEQKGSVYLSLRPAGSFLESLRLAVKAIKEG